MIIHNDRQELQKALQYVEEELKKYNLNRREATMTMLMAEESLVCMMSHTEEQEKIEIVFKKLFGNISLNISARGEAFNVSEESVLIGDMDFEGVSGDAEAAIRNLIIRSQSDIFQYKNRLHQNTIRLVVKRSERMQLYLTLGAMLLAVILGIIFKLSLPVSAQNMLNEYLLTPVKVMFLNQVLEKTPGVVLIDEIDLHLHPQWQQTILSDLHAIFPEVQFIVSSHAPAVINSVPREQIRILDQGEIYMPAAQTYGRDANSILREVMNVSERPADIKQRMDLFYAYMDENNYKEADKVLTEIEAIVGTTDPDIAAARTSLDLERILGE